MQISNTFQPFTKKTLLLVTSKQDAKAYSIYDREGAELFNFHYDTPEYTDKEGSFDRSGKNGQRIGGGETEKDIKGIAYTEFLNELNDQLDAHDLKDIEEIVLFAPEHLLQSTFNHLPKDIQAKVSKEIRGNVIHESLMELVARIQS